MYKEIIRFSGSLCKKWVYWSTFLLVKDSKSCCRNYKDKPTKNDENFERVGLKLKNNTKVILTTAIII